MCRSSPEAFLLLSPCKKDTIQKASFMESVMSVLTIHLPEEKKQRLEEKAERLQVSPEALIQASIEELLARPDDAFEQALEKVLEKNQALYRRLASGA